MLGTAICCPSSCRHCSFGPALGSFTKPRCMIGAIEALESRHLYCGLQQLRDERASAACLSVAAENQWSLLWTTSHAALQPLVRAVRTLTDAYSETHARHYRKHLLLPLADVVPSDADTLDITARLAFAYHTKWLHVRHVHLLLSGDGDDASEVAVRERVCGGVDARAAARTLAALSLDELERSFVTERAAAGVADRCAASWFGVLARDAATTTATPSGHVVVEQRNKLLEYVEHERTKLQQKKVHFDGDAFVHFVHCRLAFLAGVRAALAANDARAHYFVVDGDSTHLVYHVLGDDVTVAWNRPLEGVSVLQQLLHDVSNAAAMVTWFCDLRRRWTADLLAAWLAGGAVAHGELCSAAAAAQFPANWTDGKRPQSLLKAAASQKVLTAADAGNVGGRLHVHGREISLKDMQPGMIFAGFSGRGEARAERRLERNETLISIVMPTMRPKSALAVVRLLLMHQTWRAFEVTVVDSESTCLRDDGDSARSALGFDDAWRITEDDVTAERFGARPLLHDGDAVADVCAAAGSDEFVDLAASTCSTRGVLSENVVVTHAESWFDGRVVYLCTAEPLSIGGKMNLGFSLSRGNVHAKVDDDDWPDDARLEAQVSPLLDGFDAVYMTTCFVYVAFTEALYKINSPKEVRADAGQAMFRADVGVRYWDAVISEDANVLEEFVFGVGVPTRVLGCPAHKVSDGVREPSGNPNRHSIYHVRVRHGSNTWLGFSTLLPYGAASMRVHADQGELRVERRVRRARGIRLNYRPTEFRFHRKAVREEEVRMLAEVAGNRPPSDPIAAAATTTAAGDASVVTVAYVVPDLLFSIDEYAAALVRSIATLAARSTQRNVGIVVVDGQLGEAVLGSESLPQASCAMLQPLEALSARWDDVLREHGAHDWLAPLPARVPRSNGTGCAVCSAQNSAPPSAWLERSLLRGRLRYMCARQRMHAGTRLGVLRYVAFGGSVVLQDARALYDPERVARQLERLREPACETVMLATHSMLVDVTDVHKVACAVDVIDDDRPTSFMELAFGALATSVSFLRSRATPEMPTAAAVLRELLSAGSSALRPCMLEGTNAPLWTPVVTIDELRHVSVPIVLANRSADTFDASLPRAPLATCRAQLRAFRAASDTCWRMWRGSASYCSLALHGNATFWGAVDPNDDRGGIVAFLFDAGWTRKCRLHALRVYSHVEGAVSAAERKSEQKVALHRDEFEDVALHECALVHVADGATLLAAASGLHLAERELGVQTSAHVVFAENPIEALVGYFYRVVVPAACVDPSAVASTPSAAVAGGGHVEHHESQVHDWLPSELCNITHPWAALLAVVGDTERAARLVAAWHASGRSLSARVCRVPAPPPPPLSGGGRPRPVHTVFSRWCSALWHGDLSGGGERDGNDAQWLREAAEHVSTAVDSVFVVEQPRRSLQYASARYPAVFRRLHSADAPLWRNVHAVADVDRHICEHVLADYGAGADGVFERLAQLAGVLAQKHAQDAERDNLAHVRLRRQLFGGDGNTTSSGREWLRTHERVLVALGSLPQLRDELRMYGIALHKFCERTSCTNEFFQHG